MHKYFIILLGAALVIFSSEVFSQTDWNFVEVLPVKEQNEIMFGEDIIINPEPVIDQRQVTICESFNGWLFAAYWFNNENHIEVKIMKSYDNGMNWDLFAYSTPIGTPNVVFSSFKMITCGTSLTNLKVILGVTYFDTITHWCHPVVPVYDGVTGDFIENILDDEYAHSLDIVSDYSYSATGSNPASFGVLYSKESVHDSIIFWSSSNGGVSLDNRQVIATSVSYRYFGKVSLNYGFSDSYQNGQYYAVWEDKESDTSSWGHIYYAYSEPFFNSPFTTPLCIDSIDPSDINQSRDPVIASQYGPLDNDSSNTTTLIVFEKNNISTGKVNLKGYSSLQSSNSFYFNPFTLNNPDSQNSQPNIAFNPFDSTFIITFFNSTNQRLPYLLHDYNMGNPNQWNIVTSGYNDDLNIPNPRPQVILNSQEKSGAVVWIKKNDIGRGVAMFDAFYSTYTRIQEETSNHSRSVIAYPNPCHSSFTIEIKSELKHRITVDLYNLYGKKVIPSSNYQCISGINRIKINASQLSPGSYLCVIESEYCYKALKVVIL